MIKYDSVVLVRQDVHFAIDDTQLRAVVALKVLGVVQVQREALHDAELHASVALSNKVGEVLRHHQILQRLTRVVRGNRGFLR